MFLLTTPSCPKYSSLYWFSNQNCFHFSHLMCCYTLLPFHSSSHGHLNDSICNCVFLITQYLSLSCSIVVVIVLVVVVVVVVIVVVVVVTVATAAVQRNLM
jgi:hypothetical protein